MFVKLVAIDSSKTSPIRHFYIAANSDFKLNSIRAGKYDVRYLDLSSGALSRSEPFELEETTEFDRTNYSNVTMTLYKVSAGNMQTYPLLPEEF